MGCKACLATQGEHELVQYALCVQAWALAAYTVVYTLTCASVRCIHPLPQIRYLSPGTVLTDEEQDTLRQMLCPWGHGQPGPLTAEVEREELPHLCKKDDQE
jgi:hypothetical protein